MLSIADDELSGTTESYRFPRPGEGCSVWLSCTLVPFSLLLAFTGICFAILTATFSLYLVEPSGREDRLTTTTFHLCFSLAQRQNEPEG